MIIAVILCPPDLVLLVRSGPVIRDLGGSVRIWGDNGPVLISYFYDGAVPVKVFQNRSQSDFYMDNVEYMNCFMLVPRYRYAVLIIQKDPIINIFTSTRKNSFRFPLSKWGNPPPVHLVQFFEL